MKQIKKISIILFILFCIMPIIGLTKVNAKKYKALNVGDYVDISYQDLRNTKFIMCIQHGASLKNGKKHYKVGLIAKIGTEYGASSPIEVVKEGTDLKIENKINAKLAYIVYAAKHDSKFNSGYPSIGQRLIWNKNNGYAKWRAQVGKNLMGANSYKAQSSYKLSGNMVTLNNQANAYADFAEKYTQVLEENGGEEIKSTVSNTLNTIGYNGKNYVGPLAYNFAEITVNGATIGNLRSIIINEKEVSSVLVKEGESYKEILVKDITPKQEFYISEEFTNDNNITIQILQNAHLYSARICFLSVPGTSWQNLIWTKAKAKEITLKENATKQPKQTEDAIYNLTLEKVNENGHSLSGAKFSITADSNNKPSTFNTAMDGNSTATFKFNNSGTYVYTISEKQAPEGYVKLQENMTLTIKVELKETKFVVTSAQMRCPDGISFNGTNTLTVPNKPETPEDAAYNLLLAKVDEKGQNLSGAKFSITADSNNKPSTFNTAMDGNSTATFKFNNSGTYVYTISEKQAPEGYVKLQESMTLTIKVELKGTKYVVTSAQMNDANGISFDGKNTLTVPNKPETVNITGNVWIDELRDKGMTRNGLMDNDETLLNGIKVRLYEGNNLVKETTTAGGKYEFKEIKAKRSYRIEIEYDGMKYTTTTYLANGANNSKGEEAQSDRREFNRRFTEISASSGINYTKTDATDDKSLATSQAITDSFVIKASTDVTYQKDKTLQNVSQDVVVNFGLAKREQADFALIQSIKNVSLSINGKTFAENVAKKFDGNISEDDIKAYLAERNETRTQYIKYSDYTYRLNNYTDLKDASNIGNDISKELNISVTYAMAIRNQSAVQGTVKQIMNYYSRSYELVEVKNSAGEKLGISNVNSGHEEYDAVTIDTSSLGIMGQGSTKWIYVTYNVKKDNTRSIPLDNTISVLSEINVYSTYIADVLPDYEKFYNGTIDKDSAPGNANPTASVRTFEDDTAKAQGITFKLAEKQRTLSGLVWDDKNKNGIRENGENLVNNVIVQLVENRDGQEFIWKEMKTGTDNISYVRYAGGLVSDEKNKKTIGSGEYYFEDFIPGNYIIRFIYGDTVESIKLQNGTSYNGSDYEATKKGQGNDNTVNSDATDKEERREQVKAYAKLVDNAKGTILASPYADVIDEAKLKELANNTWMNADASSIVEVQTENVNNIDLGLAKLIENKITLEKEVSHVKITLNNGTVYMDTDIPVNNGVNNLLVAGNKLWATMDNEIINGATLEVTYKITLKNNGNDTVSNVKVIDYIPEGMRVNYSENNGWQAVEKDELNSMLNKEIAEKAKENIAIFVTNQSIDKLVPGESKNIVLTAGITLSPDKDDYNYTNIAEIVEFESENGKRNEEGIPGNQDPTSNDLKENDANKSQEFIVTKPTGNMAIYYAVAFATIVVFGFGVYAIKKYVLKK